MAKVTSSYKQALIQAFPCFSHFSPTQSEAFASLWREVNFTEGEVLALEDEIVSCIYIIVSGQAEVLRIDPSKKEKNQVPVATLSEGEGVGLNDTGFYSKTGKRTATVIASSNLLTLQLDIEPLYEFLKTNHLESSMDASALQMLRMRLIKQSLPFTKLSHERLKWLADRVEEYTVKRDTIIFNQGDKGDKCYLVCSGQIEITRKNANGKERQIAILKPPALFGEATLIAHDVRNATARALEDSELMILKHEYLSELIESEENVANMFMTLMVDRSRPIRHPQVTLHERLTADGEEVIILKNRMNGKYFKLSKEGAYVWFQLDGEHTLQDITLNLAEQFNVFAPDMVVALISKLTKNHFVNNVGIPEITLSRNKPHWVNVMTRLRRLVEFRVAFGDADRWVNHLYQKYIHFFFTALGQFFLAIIVIAGMIAFSKQTASILNFFSQKHTSLLLVFALIPLSVTEVILHELGHAFAVKSFGHEVHYMGIGWYWFSPVAFTDTSDMWLATRKPRMIVNLAGIYVDLLIAGIASASIFVVANPYVQGMLWLFALYTYVSALRNLSPLQEMDGYYALMDWVDKNHLRQTAVLWLIKRFPECLLHPRLFAQYWPEVFYWLVSIFYLILITLITLMIQAFVFNIIGMKTHSYVSLILPFIVVVLSSFSIIAEIRNRAENE